MKNLGKKIMAQAALKAAEKSVDSACIWLVHQPKVPKKLLKK